MKNISFKLNDIFDYIDKQVFDSYLDKIVPVEQKLDPEKNDWTGWYNLPEFYPNSDEFAKILETAKEIRSSGDYLVVIGIGGSYLGARAIIEALTMPFEHSKVIFAGYNLEPEYLDKLLKFLADKDFYINVISKSGTTIEPSVTFRFLKQLLEKKYNVQEVQKRIIATTDKSKGLLRELSNKNGYRTFIIPNNIGGRFSVLTPVGLLPIAVAGFDIRKLLEGAFVVQQESLIKDMDKNFVYQYVAVRDILYNNGKKIEILSSFNSSLRYFSEWWKQLFGESEGKDNKGLFPASTVFTTDLHSLGQWIQDGPRIIFETFLFVNQSNILNFPEDKENIDQLNYLKDFDVNEINKRAYLGTLQAHQDGGVPCLSFEIDKIDEFVLGELIYFFEKTTALNGYLLGVNPFNQPGVEAYKKNMFSY